MDEAERIERFEAAYNRVDRALTNEVSGKGDRRKHGFAARVRILAKRRRRLEPYVDFLLEIAELRNAIVHNRYGDGHYIAVPNEKTVLDLERIEKRMFSPERVIPRFQGDVCTLDPKTSLAEIWELMRTKGYSRFPVYGRDGFIGLLTANGIARYAAAHALDGRLQLDGHTIRATDVLKTDHRRDQVAFVSRQALLDEVDAMFDGREPLLEAVLITEHGKPHERPLGLVCPADVAGLDG